MSLRGCPRKIRPLDLAQNRIPSNFLGKTIDLYDKHKLQYFRFQYYFVIFLSTISEDGPKPKKSSCFESN